MKKRISIKFNKGEYCEWIPIKGVVTVGFLEEYLGEWIIEVTDTSIRYYPQAHERYLPSCYKEYTEDVENIARAYYNGMRGKEHVVMWK